MAFSTVQWTNALGQDEELSFQVAIQDGTTRLDDFNSQAINLAEICLSKRPPMKVLRPQEIVLSRGESSCILESVSSESGRKPKKRGRHLMSSDLESYLIKEIKAENEAQCRIPDRPKIAELARSYIRQNNVNLKCSKGWLDKFMRRNEKIIKQTSPGK